MNKTLLTIECYGCFKLIQVPDIGDYSHKQECKECGDERRKEWLERLARTYPITENAE